MFVWCRPPPSSARAHPMSVTFLAAATARSVDARMPPTLAPADATAAEEEDNNLPAAPPAPQFVPLEAVTQEELVRHCASHSGGGTGGEGDHAARAARAQTALEARQAQVMNGLAEFCRQQSAWNPHARSGPGPNTNYAVRNLLTESGRAKFAEARVRLAKYMPQPVAFPHAHRW